LQGTATPENIFLKCDAAHKPAREAGLSPARVDISLREFSTMRHASYPNTGIDSSTPTFSVQSPRRKRLFAALLEALHHSRRLQARHVIRQYRHLIPDAEPREADPRAGDQDAVS
jgi:hypothetical protein